MICLDVPGFWWSQGLVPGCLFPNAVIYGCWRRTGVYEPIYGASPDMELCIEAGDLSADHTQRNFKGVRSVPALAGFSLADFGGLFVLWATLLLTYVVIFIIAGNRWLGEWGFFLW